MTTDATVLRLDGEISIYRAAELKQTLLTALEVPGGGTLELDLSGVTELDTAGVQLLILSKRVAQQKQRTLRLSGHSPAVLDVFELLNLGAYFGDALVFGAAGARN